ncbi:MAG: heparinase II/III family protein [Verrucomicrobiales bacterium]|nr:heparinase II/III family protein [Verrucomicrobiales bacterium]
MSHAKRQTPSGASATAGTTPAPRGNHAVPQALLRAVGLGLTLITGLVCSAASDPALPVSREAIEAALQRAPRSHPRLFANAQSLSQLQEGATPTSARGRLIRETLREAEAILTAPPVTRELVGRRLLDQSRTCLGRVLVLSTAYHLTHRDEFVRRAQSEMLAAANFSDWNPSHFLDVAEMSLGLAIGYDWLHAQLEPTARLKIREALVNKALRLPLDPKHQHWIRATHNWAQVCHAGLSAAALVLLEDEPELAAHTLHSAANHVRVAMQAYAPEGSYPEGPSYWSFGTTFNVLLIAGMESVLGTDFGLSQLPGFDRTGQFLPMVTGPSGMTFNYSDGAPRRTFEPALHWFARRYQRPDWLYGEPPLVRGRPTGPGRLQALTLLWLTNPAAPEAMHLPLHWLGGGQVPISIHRSSWNDAQAVFVGLKAGSPSYNHGHLDGGSFVLDAQGLRWAVDLGADDYHRIESRGIDLWSRQQDSPRWSVFRLSHLAHNTLVIDGQPQRVDAAARFEHFSADPSFPQSRLDLTPLYAGQANSVRRGIAQLPEGRILVRDELRGLRPGAKVRWAMLTPAVPEVPRSNSVVLQQKGRTLLLEQVPAPSLATWTTADLSQPAHEWDSPNPGITLLALSAEAPPTGQLTFAILIHTQPNAKPSDASRATALRPLADWP